MKKLFLCSLVCLLLFAVNAGATPIGADTANSTEGLGDFTGTFEYSYTDANNATIKVSLTNTTPAGGGFLTAFAFNNPGNRITGASVNGPFNLLGGPSFDNSIDANPFGDFDIGAASTSSWIGGGSPNGGIAVNATQMFTFALTGANLDLLTTQSFIDELSNPQNAQTETAWFAARLRGITTGAGSDKVPATPGTPVPEPSTVLILGFGLLGIAGLSRKRLTRQN